MPKASENASAMAMVNIPPMTASLEPVPECRPTIRPRVVIIPEVKPKLRPVFSECLIMLLCRLLLKRSSDAQMTSNAVGAVEDEGLAVFTLLHCSTSSRFLQANPEMRCLSTQYEQSSIQLGEISSSHTLHGPDRAAGTGMPGLRLEILGLADQGAAAMK